jgi:polyferredoxin
MKPETVKMLGKFREILWAVLMMMMLVGVGFEWMDYEIFSAFIITSASATVLVLAAIFMILSIFVPRPYCRFVCPTGTLFKIAQNSK